MLVLYCSGGAIRVARDFFGDNTLIPALSHKRFTQHMSVITQFDELTFTIGDGQGGQDIQGPGQQNGTGIATGAVLALGG